MNTTLTLLTALMLAPLASLHAAEPKVFDITAHGAKGDGTTHEHPGDSAGGGCLS
jgi:hypothetical protein